MSPTGIKVEMNPTVNVSQEAVDEVTELAVKLASRYSVELGVKVPPDQILGSLVNLLGPGTPGSVQMDRLLVGSISRDMLKSASSSYRELKDQIPTKKV